MFCHIPDIHIHIHKKYILDKNKAYFVSFVRKILNKKFF